jgi:zinc protease
MKETTLAGLLHFSRGFFMNFILSRRVSHISGIFAILGFLAPALCLADETPALKAAAAFYEGIRTETLDNGLRVYLKPVPNSPVVTVMVAYRVGSGDEELSHTGLAHYLEHLMFKGTDKIMPGQIDRMTLRNGGTNNAYTSEDYTVYHFDFDAEHWQSALEIEADRMRNLRIDARHEFEQEKGAVVGELESNEDEPGDLEQKTILPLIFADGPYGHPVIGMRDHVRGASAEVIKGYYDRWYHPNNAALIFSGGFDPDVASRRVKELFGSIPAGKLPERRQAPAVERSAPVHKEMESKFDVPRLFIGYNGVRSGSPDDYVLDVIESLLTGGKTGRLYKKLVEDDQVASSVACGNTAGRYPGWFLVRVELLKGKDIGKTEELVLAQLKELAEKPVDAAELNRVKKSIIASNIFAHESVHALADSIARGVMNNDLDYLKSYLPRIQAVTAEDVQRVAQKYLDPERRVSLWSHPHKEAAGSGGTGEGKNPHRRPALRKDAAGGMSFNLDKSRRVELPNGLTLLLFEDHRLPIVVAEASVHRVTLYEPENKAGVATLVGELMDEGTPLHTGRQISEMIENVGGVLNFSVGGGAVKVLTPDRALGLGVLFDCLSQASFPEDAFRRQKAQLLSAIDDAERQPETQARKAFRALVYGSHPFGRPTLGRRDTVKKLTPADCQAFHHGLYVPNNTTVAIVGDFHSDEIVSEITRLTAGWKKADLPGLKLPVVERPPQFEEQILSMPEAAQLHFLLGHVGIRRANPDYYKLLVMDYVLGTGPGFTDRLSARLRDREGLGYTVTANITASAGEEPGMFTCYIGTAPKNFGRVKELFLEELNRIRDEPPSKQEVDDAKQFLIGNLLFKFTTIDKIASQLLFIDRHHLGSHYIEDYLKAVAAVTPEDVQAVARKYIDPEKMILVAAGAIDSNGKVPGSGK